MIAVTLVMVLSAALPVIGNVLTHTAPMAASTTAAESASAASAAVSAAANVAPATSPVSPHQGTLVNDFIAPGGATAEDTAVAYDTVSYEPMLNVYETLVAYNGSNATGTNPYQFVPVAATCVPGTHQCTSDYGASMPGFTGMFDKTGAITSVVGDAVYWTFVIDPAAHFYDAGNATASSIYPSDVMYSIAREMAYSEAIGVGNTPGWLIAQALLPNGSAHFDGGIHAPYNTTPEAIYGSMLINNTNYCPATAMSSMGNGCITFIADGAGAPWPFFLQLIGDGFMGILPADWYTANGAGLPGWTMPLGGPSSPDHGVLLPDGGTTTTGVSWSNFLANLNTTGGKTSWDAFETGLATTYPAPAPHIQWNMVGSGPYYSIISAGVGYSLIVSPGYQQPSGCNVTSGYAQYGGYCWPAADPPGTTNTNYVTSDGYVPDVSVTYEQSDTNGIAAYKSGGADFAGIYTTDTAELLSLAASGKLNYYSAPSLSTFFMPFNLDFSSSAYSTDALPSGLNVPNDFFSGSAVRGLMTHAMPYATAESTANTVDGVQFSYMAGGPVAKGMVGYPDNISYPFNACDASPLTQTPCNPVTNPTVAGSAAWWWAQGTNPTSPYYDAELAACLHRACVFPIIGENGAPNLDIIIGELITEIEAITSNHVKPYTYDLNFGGPGSLIDYQLGGEGPGGAPLPFWNLGWAADNFAPSDYLIPMAFPNSTYTYGDSVEESLLGSPSTLAADQAACGHGAKSLADLLYWAANTTLPQQCQGVAYNLVNEYLYDSTHSGGMLDAAYIYAIQAILANLNLYVYFGQENQVTSAAPWINPSSLNFNPTVGGGGDTYYFQVQYNPVESNVTFSETGLTSGSNSWSISAGSPVTAKQNLTGGPLSFFEPSGALSFHISSAFGTVASVTGGVGTTTGGTTVSGDTSLLVTFTPKAPSTNSTLEFTETGLTPGTAYTVTIDQTGHDASGTGTNGTTAPGALNFTVTSGTSWKYTVTATGLWKGNTKGHVHVTTNTVKAITFTQVLEKVSFKAKGLPRGTTWGVNISGVGNFSTTTPVITQSLGYGTYSFEVWNESGFTVTPAGINDWTALTIGSARPLTIHVGYDSDKVIFAAHGLAHGTSWTIEVTNASYSATVSGTAGTEKLTLPYGVYNYTASAVGYSDINGTFVVNVTHPPVHVTLDFVAAPVQFGGVPLQAVNRQQA